MTAPSGGCVPRQDGSGWLFHVRGCGHVDWAALDADDRCPYCAGSRWVKVATVTLGGSVVTRQPCTMCLGTGRVRLPPPPRPPWWRRALAALAARGGGR